MIEEIKTVKISSKRQITIPASFDLLEAGDKAILKIENNKIIIEPLKEYEKSLECALASEKAFAKNWLSENDEKAYAHFQKYVKK